MKNSRRNMIIDLISRGRTDAEVLAVLEKAFPNGTFLSSNAKALAGTKWDLESSVKKVIPQKVSLISPKPIQLREHNRLGKQIQLLHYVSINNNYRAKHLVTKSSCVVEKIWQMDIENLENIKKELQIKRSVLISMAHNAHLQIDETDRKNIIQYLEQFKTPQKPNIEISLSKEFVSSCLSSNQPPHRMRGKLKSLIGKIPLAETIPLCLSLLFNEPEFLNDDNWTFNNLGKLANKLKFALGKVSDMKLAILEILQNGSLIMGNELKTGIESFYFKVNNEIKKGPEVTWKFMDSLTKPIPGIGPGLFSDFLKNIGFVEFVKIDYHFKNEFSFLMQNTSLSAKQQFIYSLQICNKLEISPFYFDHILYQWGRYKKLAK